MLNIIVNKFQIDDSFMEQTTCFSWARICKCLWSPGIDSEESISPAYVAWRAGTTNRVVVLASRNRFHQAGNRFLGSLKCLQIQTYPGSKGCCRTNMSRGSTDCCWTDSSKGRVGCCRTDMGKGSKVKCSLNEICVKLWIIGRNYDFQFFVLVKVYIELY
jgi:hypothetical protein